MKNLYFLVIGLLTLQTIKAQVTTGQSWFSYGNENMGGYSWTNSALTTNSIEIVNNNGMVSNSSPTLAFHRYGTGGPQFRLAADGSNVFYLESSGYNSARNPNAYGGGPNNYFSRLHIDGGLTTVGNVGIGTSSPDDLFDTKGAALFGPLTERLSLGSGSFGFNRRVANGQIFDSGQFAYQMQHTGSSTQGNDYLAFQVYNPNSSSVTPYALAINSTGNVGIGTPNPDAKLAVNGTIHAKEIKVDLNVLGADYVFEKSYPLWPLSTVNKYISVNHHLPDMPSAKSMEKNGIDVSGMNMKLLQKVEELTLYLIEKDKNDKQQQAQINSLNRKLKVLSRRVKNR